MNCHSSYSSLLNHLLSSGCGELFPFHTFKFCMCHLVSELAQLHMFFQCLLSFFPCHVFSSPFVWHVSSPIFSISIFHFGLFHFIFCSEPSLESFIHSWNMSIASSCFAFFCFYSVLYGFPFCTFQRFISAAFSVPMFALVIVHVNRLCVNTGMCQLLNKRFFLNS